MSRAMPRPNLPRRQIAQPLRARRASPRLLKITKPLRAPRANRKPKASRLRLIRLPVRASPLPPTKAHRKQKANPKPKVNRPRPIRLPVRASPPPLTRAHPSPRVSRPRLTRAHPSQKASRPQPTRARPRRRANRLRRLTRKALPGTKPGLRQLTRKSRRANTAAFRADPGAAASRGRFFFECLRARRSISSTGSTYWVTDLVCASLHSYDARCSSGPR